MRFYLLEGNFKRCTIIIYNYYLNREIIDRLDFFDRIENNKFA